MDVSCLQAEAGAMHDMRSFNEASKRQLEDVVRDLQRQVDMANK
jgi:hypothetical protein